MLQLYIEIHDKIPAKSTHVVKNGIGKSILQEEGPEIFARPPSKVRYLKAELNWA